MPDALPSLLPCPFCGGEATFALAAGFIAVACANEDCSPRPVTRYTGTHEEATAVWNTRAPSRVLASVEGTACIVARTAWIRYAGGMASSPGEWMREAFYRLCADGRLIEGQPIRITITAEEEADHG